MTSADRMKLLNARMSVLVPSFCYLLGTLVSGSVRSLQKSGEFVACLSSV